MSRIFISPGGALATPLMPKRSVLPDLGGRLFSAHILATDAFGTGKLVGTPATDLSGNGRDLAFTGAGPGAKWLPASPTSFGVADYTSYEAWRIANELTLVTVATSGPTGGFPMWGSMKVSAGDQEQYFAMLQSSGSVVDAWNNPPQASRAAPVSTPNSPPVARDADLFEVNAGSWSTKGGIVYRRRASMGATVTATNYLRPGYGGDNSDPGVKMTAGAAAFAADRSGYNGTGKLVMVMTLCAVIEDFDEQIYAPVSALMGDLLGLTV